jgi:hypothetical protein
VTYIKFFSFDISMSCSICTFINNPNKMDCVMCGAQLFLGLQKEKKHHVERYAGENRYAALLDIRLAELAAERATRVAVEAEAARVAERATREASTASQVSVADARVARAARAARDYDD